MGILAKIKEAIGRIANRIRSIRKKEEVIVFEEKPIQQIEKKEIPKVEKEIEKTKEEIKEVKQEVQELKPKEKKPLQEKIKEKEEQLKAIQKRIEKKKKLLTEKKRIEKEKRKVEYIHRYYFECKVIGSPHYISRHYFNYSSRLKTPDDLKALRLHNFHYPEHKIINYQWISIERKEYILIK